MKTYKKHITIEDPNYIILSDLPFQPGQRVEVIVVAENNERAVIVEKLRELLKETQALHADNPLTEEEIVAEIEAFRRGE